MPFNNAWPPLVRPLCAPPRISHEEPRRALQVAGCQCLPARGGFTRRPFQSRRRRCCSAEEYEETPGRTQAIGAAPCPVCLITLAFCGDAQLPRQPHRLRRARRKLLQIWVKRRTSPRPQTCVTMYAVRQSLSPVHAGLSAPNVGVGEPATM